ncbi:hypothetical protein CLAFUW4_08966 [Fulvia fulva]|nr:hypothetical protein CLAFUR4_08972 [Fulvia fulva]KAK4614835.1 hypothetical protein CLAFUR0_08964 [Fulvia fulva]WPV20201.1 hypothetical protein CLAFUW4_08966 [Fulvia fulva]WPV35738.1 hypothetical protein CLAFUW7_08967 [Fulvia fulva]
MLDNTIRIRPHEMDNMAASRAQPTLPQLLKSQEHADFLFRTKTREFPVHKCIISTRSAFFRGATRGDFKEAHNGIVEVEERAEVIEALLELIYETPLSFIPRKDDTWEVKDQKATLGNVQLAIGLQLAADKYLVYGYGENLTLAIAHCFDNFDKGIVDGRELAVQMATQVFRKDVKVDIVPRVWTVLTLAKSLEELMADPGAWALLLRHGDLLKAITEVALKYHEDIMPPCRLTDLGQEMYWSNIIGAVCRLAEVDAKGEKYSVKEVLAGIKVLCRELDTGSPGD